MTRKEGGFRAQSSQTSFCFFGFGLAVVVYKVLLWASRFMLNKCYWSGWSYSLVSSSHDSWLPGLNRATTKRVRKEVNSSDHLYSIFRVPTWGLSRQQELCTAKQSFPWVWPWGLLSRVLDSSVRWSAKSAPYEVKDKLPSASGTRFHPFPSPGIRFLREFQFLEVVVPTVLTAKWGDTSISL